MDNSVKRGDIFYADLSPVVGSEQGGVRPVLIVQNDTGNRHSPTVIAAAITSQTGKAKLPTHIELAARQFGLPKDSVILLEQIRTLDKKTPAGTHGPGRRPHDAPGRRCHRCELWTASRYSRLNKWLRASRHNVCRERPSRKTVCTKNLYLLYHPLNVFVSGYLGDDRKGPLGVFPRALSTY